MQNPQRNQSGAGGFIQENAPGIPQAPQRNNVFTMADYERLLIARYISGGHTRETALHFAHGEIRAILASNHWTHGKPTAPDPQRLITDALNPDDRERFTERAAIMEYDGGLSRADAKAQALREILAWKYPAPEKPACRGSAAIKKTLAVGIPLKNFYAKSKDNDPAAYTSDLGVIAGLWKQEVRRFKAFIRGRFLVLDIDRKPGKADGLKSFYKLFPREIMPEALRDILH